MTISVLAKYLATSWEIRICVLLGRKAELHPQKSSAKITTASDKMRFMNGKNMEEKWVHKFFLGMGDTSPSAAEALVLILAMMSNRIASCDPVKK